MASEWIERLRGQLASRTARERKVLAAGGVVLLVLVGYGAVYEPLGSARAKLAARLPVQRAELRLMRVQAEEVERLRSHLGAAAKGSLEQRVKSAAAAYNLGEAFTQFDVLTQDQVQLTTQPLPTATWTAWLDNLERQGVSVSRCRITPGSERGLASLEMTVTGGRR